MLREGVMQQFRLHKSYRAAGNTMPPPWDPPQLPEARNENDGDAKADDAYHPLRSHGNPPLRESYHIIRCIKPQVEMISPDEALELTRSIMEKCRMRLEKMPVWCLQHEVMEILVGLPPVHGPSGVAPRSTPPAALPLRATRYPPSSTIATQLCHARMPIPFRTRSCSWSECPSVTSAASTPSSRWDNPVNFSVLIDRLPRGLCQLNGVQENGVLGMLFIGNMEDLNAKFDRQSVVFGKFLANWRKTMIGIMGEVNEGGKRAKGAGKVKQENRDREAEEAAGLLETFRTGGRASPEPEGPAEVVCLGAWKVEIEKQVGSPGAHYNGDNRCSGGREERREHAGRGGLLAHAKPSSTLLTVLLPWKPLIQVSLIRSQMIERMEQLSSLHLEQVEQLRAVVEQQIAGLQDSFDAQVQGVRAQADAQVAQLRRLIQTLAGK